MLQRKPVSKRKSLTCFKDVFSQFISIFVIVRGRSEYNVHYEYYIYHRMLNRVCKLIEVPIVKIKAILSE